MNAVRDPDRLISAFLLEGEEQLHDQVYDAVRAAIERKRQRVVIGPWRMPDMNKLVPIGLAAAAVIALVIGVRQLAPTQGGVGTAPSAVASVAPSPSAVPSSSAQPSGAPAPSSSTAAAAGLRTGPHVLSAAADPVKVTVNIASPGWAPLADFNAVTKNDDGLDAPKTVGAALLAWGWPAGTGFDVYGDPCQWKSTIPETPATTPGQIAAALARQASTDATAPVDVTVGGFAGKQITLRVPISFDLPNATREQKFAACDEETYAFYGIAGRTTNERNAQGAGQIDELWILDVNGSTVILDAAFSPATPAALVEETRALARSATFATP